MTRTPLPTIIPGVVRLAGDIVLLSRTGVVPSEDIEIIDSELVGVLRDGGVIPEGTLTGDNRGSLIGEAIDIEPAGPNEFYVLGRDGSIAAYGIDSMGELRLTQQVRVGRNTFTIPIPAVDLEVVNAGGNVGYYVAYADGTVEGFGSVAGDLFVTGFERGTTLASIDVRVDGNGNVVERLAMDTYGRITSNEVRIPSPALREHAEDPVVVDFVRTVDGQILAVNELGTVYSVAEDGTVTIVENEPLTNAELLGRKGFIDIEVGVLNQ